MANPAGQFPSAPPKYADNGSGMKLLQPDNQVAFVANDDPDISTKLRDALVTAGIMKPA